MTRIVRNWLGISALVVALALGTGLPASAQDAPTADSAAKPAAKSAPKRVAQQGGTGHVYLLRGLLNIFSLGMDDLAAKIQAKGISASVHNHSEWQGLADEIAAKYKAGKHGPIILVGHSLGADAVMYMAEYLGTKGVPVALVVPFDGTGSFAAASNVAQVMNLTQRDYAYMRRGPGFRGVLQNIDVSRDSNIGHINIDKSPRLHAMVVNKIASVVGRGGGGGAPAPKPAPTEAKPAGEGAPAAAPSAPAPSVPSGSSASTSPAAASANASAAAVSVPATTSSVPAVR
jgi:pimeloyl-ACP methyl ester carboxylesterase